MTAGLRLAPIILLLLLGCAPRQAATAWPYSHWYQRDGGGSLGNFEAARDQCLAQAGAAATPNAVAPNSSEEDAFIECMNGSDWCTQQFRCEKPGA